MSEPTPAQLATCPMCGQPVQPGHPVSLTARELAVLSAWWHMGSVKRAALLAGVGEQRAKNLLMRARGRNGAATTVELASMFFDRLRADLAAEVP